MKVVHCVCYDRKFIPQQLAFLNRHFQEHAQKFYLMGVHDDYLRTASSNVFRLSRMTLPKFVWEAHRADRIIFNGLFNHAIPILFLAFPWLIRKGIWIPWGGDLYWKQYVPDTFKNRVIDYLRGVFIRRLYGIATPTRGDYEKAVSLYDTRSRYLDSCPNIFSFDQDDLMRAADSATTRHSQGKTRIIQIGNSADPSNEHLEMLRWMRHFANEDIRIYVPLSYGYDDESYVQDVIAAGKEWYGEKFVPLTKLMSPEEYNRHLAAVDVLVLNHKRQQGLGNMAIALYFGTKIFLRKGVSTWNYLSEVMKCEIFDTNEVRHLAFHELVSIDQGVQERNRKAVAHLFDRQWQKKMWEKIFSG